MVEASLVCLQCGREIGCLERTVRAGAPTEVVFRPVGAMIAGPVTLAGIRCAVCRGVAIVESERTLRQWDEQIDWSLDRPRRGRPPGWLVEQRRRDRAR
jgi:hypothetical protein